MVAAGGVFGAAVGFFGPLDTPAMDAAIAMTTNFLVQKFETFNPGAFNWEGLRFK